MIGLLIKYRNFYSLLYLRLVLAVTSSEFHNDIQVVENRNYGATVRTRILTMCLAVLTQYRIQTDRTGIVSDSRASCLKFDTRRIRITSHDVFAERGLSPRMDVDLTGGCGMSWADLGPWIQPPRPCCHSVRLQRMNNGRRRLYVFDQHEASVRVRRTLSDEITIYE